MFEPAEQEQSAGQDQGSRSPQVRCHVSYEILMHLSFGPYDGCVAMPNLAERLQSVRKRRGLTQKDLAALSGVSLSLIRKLEQGEREDTRLETLRKLAKALEVATSDLIVRPEPEGATSDDWAPVRDALLRKNGQPEETPTVDGVRGAVEAAEPLFTDNRYAELGRV